MNINFPVFLTRTISSIVIGLLVILIVDLHFEFNSYDIQKLKENIQKPIFGKPEEENKKSEIIVQGNHILIGDSKVYTSNPTFDLIRSNTYLVLFLSAFLIGELIGLYTEFFITDIIFNNIRVLDNRGRDYLEIVNISNTKLSFATLVFIFSPFSFIWFLLINQYLKGSIFKILLSLILLAMLLFGIYYCFDNYWKIIIAVIIYIVFFALILVLSFKEDSKSTDSITFKKLNDFMKNNERGFELAEMYYSLHRVLISIALTLWIVNILDLFHKGFKNISIYHLIALIFIAISFVAAIKLRSFANKLIYFNKSRRKCIQSFF